jgi:PAS domain S-box-containing protein
MATVLIVDDNKADRTLISTLLRHRQHSILEAPDGLQGLAIAQAERPDLVVSDILMPGIDGYELAHLIRTDPALTGTAVVFYSAFDVEADASLSEICGVDHVIPKPCEPGRILQILDAALSAPPGVMPASTAEAFERSHMRVVTDALYERVEALKRANLDLRRIQENMRMSEGRFRTLLESIPDAVVGADGEGRITVVNAQTEVLFGYGREELLGLLVEVLLPDWVRPALVNHRSGSTSAPIPRLMGIGLHLTGRRKNGSEFAASVSQEAIETDEGMLILGAVRDISERLALEARARQSERLESLGQLAGGIAHDFNNVLAVILNYAHFVLDELPADSAAREDVKEIQRAAERAAELTHQLLIFGRREVIRPEPLDLNQSVSEIEKLLNRTIGEQVQLITKFEPDLWRVRADPSQIEQVLLNLVVNARDALPSGGTVKIVTRNIELEEGFGQSPREHPSGRFACLAVADTGVGMPAQVVAHAFEPFFTTKVKGQGSGLGLATVHGIVSQAGGQVEIHSQEGVGTVVSVYLPALGQEVARPSDEKKAVVEGKGETILVVEDEEPVRELTRRILSTSGYVVFTADGANQALEICRRHVGDIDLLLTDVVMPDVSGSALAEHVTEVRPGIGVLFMSGYPEDIIVHQGIVRTGVSLIEKPFNRERLLAGVRGALDGTGLGAVAQ